MVMWRKYHVMMVYFLSQLQRWMGMIGSSREWFIFCKIYAFLLSLLSTWQFDAFSSSCLMCSHDMFLLFVFSLWNTLFYDISMLLFASHIRSLVITFDAISTILFAYGFKDIFLFFFSSTGWRPGSYCHGVVSVMRPSVRPFVHAWVCKHFLRKNFSSETIDLIFTKLHRNVP